MGLKASQVSLMATTRIGLPSKGGCNLRVTQIWDGHRIWVRARISHTPWEPRVSSQLLALFDSASLRLAALDSRLLAVAKPRKQLRAAAVEVLAELETYVRRSGDLLTSGEV